MKKILFFSLLLILLLFSCSKNKEDLIETKYLITEINHHDGVTDDIIYVSEIEYDSEGKLFLIKSFSKYNVIDISRTLFKYNDLGELTLIRKEGGGNFYELEVIQEKGKITIKGWDQPYKKVYHYNEARMITLKEVWYSISSPNTFNFTYNNENQLVEIYKKIGSITPEIITFNNYIASNPFPFSIYVGTFGDIELILSHAFNLEFGNNGVPTTSIGNPDFENFEYNFDEHKNIVRMKLNTNNVFSFKYKIAN
ncbi:MAG: hypothetical protein JKY73_05705 [Lutibacter sp.]|nr:hypothetical protein [Lutibacter sp.]